MPNEKGEVKMPVAAEEAKELAKEYPPDDSWDSGSDYEACLTESIADIQRRTILAAASELFNVAVLRTEWGSDVEWGYRKATEELERLAASLGEAGR